MEETSRSPWIQAERTSAAAFGELAKQPECIFTPEGTPITGSSGVSEPDSDATMSLVVPSPPEYTSKSIPASSNLATASWVSDAEVFPGD